MNNIESFDEYFASIEIKILISINEFNDSLYFSNLGEFNLFLKKSKFFDEDNCFKTINFINRKLKSLGKDIEESFYIGFEDSF
jgi:hypothetical protein